MRNFLLVSFASIFFLSCNKNIEYPSSRSNYAENIKANLKDSLTVSDYANLDFERSVTTKNDNDNWFFRVPFAGKKFSEEFILLHTDTSGKVLKGLIIQLQQDKVINDGEYGYDGRIQIQHLNRTINVISDIKNGYITAFHKSSIAQRSFVVPDKQTILPEVVVTCYIGSPGTSYGSFTNLVNLSALFQGYGSGTSGYYSSVDPSQSNGAGGSASADGSSGENNNSQIDFNYQGKSGGIDEDNPALVDFEPEDFSPINLQQYLKCFSNIPDNGSICYLKILVDIPVDNEPNEVFNWRQGSPGHTFLQITKTNGSQSVTQNIGFYPNGSWKMLLNYPVQSKIVDNSEHEFNASLTMDITPEQLNNTLNYMTNIATRDYDMDDFNCTDFALDVFNSSRIANPIEIQKFPIPGGLNPKSSTPGELYNKLNTMQNSSIESGNIELASVKNFACDSKGPCN